MIIPDWRYIFMSPNTTHRKKESTIGGIFEIISRPYEDHKPVFPSQITNGEVYPYRVKVKPLIEKLEFITNKKKWSGYLVGKAMRGWVEKRM